MDVFLFAVAAAAVYLVASAIWPRTRCMRCGGSGRRPSIGWPFLIAAVGVLILAANVEADFLVAPVVILTIAGFIIKGGAWRDCPRCGGSGRRIRAGARFTGRG